MDQPVEAAVELRAAPASSACATFGRRSADPGLLDASHAFACSRLAAIAGLKVKAMKTDNAIAETMVAENWR